MLYGLTVQGACYKSAVLGSAVNLLALQEINAVPRQVLSSGQTQDVASTRYSLSRGLAESAAEAYRPV